MIRFFDIVLSSFGLLLLSPLLTVIFIVALFDTDAPLFRQERLGRYELPFILIKFRSMHKNTGSIASHLVDTAAITSYGHFLRRTKLDELPQLWNVLKGEMSLVGPRPGLLNQPELTAARKEAGVFNVRPGMTGLAQVSGIDMSTPDLLAQTDGQMISEMSLKNYFKYIFLTATGQGIGDCIKS
jgi:O-antigen biosynthesis protein WbqP